MEKLTIVGNFTKTLELLRNTECTSKEKINYFHQISDFIISPAMTSQPNYAKYCSNAIGILLLFCEDLDTPVRMNAEENLNKVIRSMETNRVSRILHDLFNEIKKNGNERSLRICLKLFGFYCPKIKEKHVKWYAVKLLSPLQLIVKRKERDLQETLVKFMESYGINLQVCLNDNETVKLLEVILLNIISDCPVKRRSSAQMCVTLIENSKNKSKMASQSINKCVGFLKNDVGENCIQKKRNEKENEHKQNPQTQQQQEQQQTNTLLGVLGFFRLLFPILISENLAFDVLQIIEIYDFCLYLLNNHNHSIINASLEVINSILMRLPGNEKLVEILTNGSEPYKCVITQSNEFIAGNNEERFLQNEFLKKRKSLKNQIFQLYEKKLNTLCDMSLSTPPPRPPKPSHLTTKSPVKSTALNTISYTDRKTCTLLNVEGNHEQQEQLNKLKNRNEIEQSKKHFKSIFTIDYNDNDNNAECDDDGALQKRKSPLKTTITNDFSGALVEEELNKHQQTVQNVNKNKNEEISSKNLFVDDDDDGLVIESPLSITKNISDSDGDVNENGDKKNNIQITMLPYVVSDTNESKKLFDDNNDIDESKSLSMMVSSFISSSSQMDTVEEVLKESGERALLEEKENLDGFSTLSNELNEYDDSHSRINTSEDKSQLLSDLDNESFNSIDFESEITIDSEQLTEKTKKPGSEKSSSITSDWRLQKSTESIGSFFNSLLSNSHTESVTKLFRPSIVKSSSSVTNTNEINIDTSNDKPNQNKDQIQQPVLTMSMTNEESVGKIEGCNSMTSSIITKDEKRQHQQIPLASSYDTASTAFSNLVTTLTVTTPKIERKINMTTIDDDTISLESINSHISMFSHVSYQSSSGTQDFILKNEQDLDIIQENQHQQSVQQSPEKEKKDIVENFIKNYNVDNDDEIEYVESNNQNKKNELESNHHQHHQQQHSHHQYEDYNLDEHKNNEKKDSHASMYKIKADCYDKVENLKSMMKIATNEEKECEQQENFKQDEKRQNMARSRTLSTDSNCSNISKKYNPFNNLSNIGFSANNLGPYLEIGDIYDQNIIYYTIRLITTKFLLTGTPYFGSQITNDITKSLISDQKVLVSIKHLSLMVIGNCIKLMPQALQIPLEFDLIELEKIREFNEKDNADYMSSTSTSNNSSQDLEKSPLQPIEEAIPQIAPKDSLSNSQSNGNFELEIKDDHFGESTATEILLNYPMSRSCDSSQLKSELKSSPQVLPKFEESKGAKPKSKFSLLSKLIPQPKVIDSKTEFHVTVNETPEVLTKISIPINNVSEDKPPILPRRKSLLKHSKTVTNSDDTSKETQDKNIYKIVSPMKSPMKKLIAPNPNKQFVSDILLFYKHSDPVLRGDVQVIVGNFLYSALKSGFYNIMLNDIMQCNKILYGNENDMRIPRESVIFAKYSLNIERLMAILIMGLRDEIHTVVIHALTSFDKIFPLVMLKHFNHLYQIKNNEKKTKKEQENMKYVMLNMQEKKFNLNNNKNENKNKNIKIEMDEKRNIIKLPSAEITMYKDCDTQDKLIDKILMMIKIRKNFYLKRYNNNKNEKSFIENYDYNNQSKSNNNLKEFVVEESKDENDNITLKMILDEIRLCCHSKNWSVQNKYIEMITNFNIFGLQEAYCNYNDDKNNVDTDNDEIILSYQRILINEFIEFLGNDDFRVRNHAIQNLPQFIRNQCFIEANLSKMKSRHQLQSKKLYDENQYENFEEQKQHEWNRNQYQYWQNQQNNLSLLTEEKEQNNQEKKYQEQQQQHQYLKQQQQQQYEQQHEQMQQLYITNFNLVKELFNYRIFYGLSPTFGNLLNAKCLPSNQIEKLLAKVLYILTNKLMELNNKNLQIGVIGAIKTLLYEFHPIDFYEQWNEFNIVSICMQFAYENYPLATDLSCQNDLIDITTTLLSANMLHNSKTIDNNLIETLFGHVMKILNIYNHLLGNQKPILFGKSHKNELFQNSKEIAIISNYGYFGNDYLYIKLYNLLKISFDNYKIQIKPDSGETMIQLLKTCLNALSTLLDIREHATISSPQETTKSSFTSVLGTPAKKSNNNQNINNSSTNNIQFTDIKIIEEILQYLTTLINYQPVECIMCLRQLLKFLFGNNYASRKTDYEKFIKIYLKARKQIFSENNFNENLKKYHNNIIRNDANTILISKKNNEEPELYVKDETEILQVKNQQNNSYNMFVMENLDKNKIDVKERISEQQKQQQEQQKEQHKLYSPRVIKQNNIHETLKQETEIILLDLFRYSMNFPLGKSKSEEDCAKYIKLFDPLVIFCLPLFMKSNAVIQRPILDLLSQLLEFNVTYSVLDSKQMIFEQIIKMLESIENGIARNSTIIVMSIMRFLVNLARKNDKKLITIPKIINYTSSLLANNSIRKCSILALKGLAFELFFNEMPNRSNSKLNKIASVIASTPTSISLKSSDSNASLDSYNKSFLKNNSSFNFLSNDKESNIQKEVVLNMLEKFIDYSECAKIMVILLLWRNVWFESNTPNENDEKQEKFQQEHSFEDSEKKVNIINSDGKILQDNKISMDVTMLDRSSKIMKTSQINNPSSPMAFATSLQNGGIFTIVSKEICDGKIKVNNWNDFYILDSIFKNSDKNFLLDSKIYSSLLGFFIKKTITNFNDLSLATIILDNVILKAEEIYLVNHIKLYLKNQNKVEKCQKKTDIKEELEYQQNHYQEKQYLKEEEKQENLNLNQNQKDVFLNTTTNEINYFANILYEKLDQCILTLMKSYSENQQQQQQQQHQQNLLFGILGSSSFVNSVNSLDSNSSLNNGGMSNCSNDNYYYENNIYQQIYQEFNGPESYNKFSKLVVKFIKSIYKDSILKKDSLNTTLHFQLEQNEFWLKYNLNNSCYEQIKVEIFRMFYIMVNEFNFITNIKINTDDDNDNPDYNSDGDNNITHQNNLNRILLLKKLKNINHRHAKRILIKEIIMKFPHPNLWSLPEIEILLKDFMIILLTDAQHFIYNLCEISKLRTIFVEYLIEYCNNASKDELFIILNFMNNASKIAELASATVTATATTTSEASTTMKISTEATTAKKIYQNNCLPIEIKLEIMLKIRTKVQYNRVLQKLIEQIMQNEIETHGWDSIQMILSKKNIHLDSILTGNKMIHKDTKDNLSELDSSTIDENWLISQIIKYSSITNPEQFVNILYDIKSETKLKQILYSENFNIKLILKSALKISLEIMLKQFQNDCIQYNPHINYMNLNPLARVSLHILKESLDNLKQLIVECKQQEKEKQCQMQSNAENLNNEFWYLSTCVIALLENIKRIYNIGLMYVDARLLQKFIKDQILKSETLVDSLITFLLHLSNYVKDSLQLKNVKNIKKFLSYNCTKQNNNIEERCKEHDNSKKTNTSDNKSNSETLINSDSNCDNHSTSGDIENNDNDINFSKDNITMPCINNKNNVSITSFNICGNNNYNINKYDCCGCTNNDITYNDNKKSIEIFTYCKCIDLLLKENLIWFEMNESDDNICGNNTKGKYEHHLNTILEFIHIGLIRSIGNTFFYRKYKLQKKNSSENNIEMENNLKYNASSSSSCLENDIKILQNKLELYEEIDDDNVTSDKLMENFNLKKNDIELNDTIDDGDNKNEIFYKENTEINEKSNYNSYNKKKIIEKAIFIANVIETDCNINLENSSYTSLLDILKSIGISLLRMNNFYAYAVTPFEIIEEHHGDYYDEMNDQCYQKRQGNRKQSGKLPSIPVEELSDVDILRKFVKRLSIFGFTSRQQFEEYFMTFLLLINTDYNDSMVDIQEQFQIRNICLKAILELLITYKTFPIVGNKLSSFHHTTRWSKIKCDNISTKKLYKVQLLVPGSNVFYIPNLERNLSSMLSENGNDGMYNIKNSSIGTDLFQANQYDLNFVWQLMENSNMEPDIKNNVHIKNFQYFRQQSEIDFKSSSQLTFDIITQLIENNYVLALPNLVKFCEICENRDQVKWIKQKVLKLQETISIDDTISHQHIIYLLCKTQSMLIPSTSDLSHLCSLISNYLKSSHVFIRNATLHGLLSLLECCSKTNTTIGKLSDELSMLRDLIIGYIIRHGIIEESSLTFSDLHTKLVWTLNFSLIEMTVKFVPDCNLLSNTIISANNLLKRTSNEEIYLCVLHGLERIVATNIVSSVIRSKIEKLALELVKIDNERFSIPALKLLLTCVYMGSTKQLENTELSNGIVQDDPEIIIQQTDKVDILLHCIKSSKKSAAQIYGKVLCQIVRDLVPPKEILTKVIKEFLAINQPHCEVIASIVHQVFRSAIDSSFLQMLQEWLICSLPTFLNLTEQKSIWSLTVIFISSSINLHLIKLFPVVLANYNENNREQRLLTIDKFNKSNSYQSEINLFVTSAKDFYSKLNQDQKLRFKEVFQSHQKQQQQQNQHYNQGMQHQQQQQQKRISCRGDGKVFQLVLDSL
ncbi:protein PFC0760c isoform X2 [Condylostylus longicornis]|uniref:protein PFC0760c isoform X2 n=1 Tax=Condylostylus longicornis TaxID=2530218 RepID=UPI00244E5693|nr:protein PFC0760c isoform X2 [Condylostylus longicornis]